MDSLEQIFITIGAIAGSAGLWKYFETKMKLKEERKKAEIDNDGDLQYREDLKERVEKMSKQLEEANEKILLVTKKVGELEVENKYLQREIDILKRSNS